jgi:hypothetical protein
MAAPRRPIKRGPGKRMVDGRDFRLADEVRHIQQCAARHDGRIVTVGQLILFSTQTGDAWLLDATDRLAAQLARDGDPEPIYIEETDANFTIDWKGHYRIEGDAFVFVDRKTAEPELSSDTRRTGSNTPRTAAKISNMFG